MKTEDLIIQLARQARPIQTLPAPSARFARWIVAMLPVAVAGLLAFGTRGDVFSALRQPAFLGRAGVTMLTASMPSGRFASAAAISVKLVYTRSGAR